eukprot:6177270-Amphidinium_carterae.1
MRTMMPTSSRQRSRKSATHYRKQKYSQESTQKANHHNNSKMSSKPKSQLGRDLRSNSSSHNVENATDIGTTQKPQHLQRFYMSDNQIVIQQLRPLRHSTL